jgi:hypothetical protein
LVAVDGHRQAKCKAQEESAQRLKAVEPLSHRRIS